MSFTNLYYKRAAGTSRACYICYKPTTTVLATINTVDFIYVCENHLTDPGFASKLGESGDGVDANGAKKMGLSPDEIAKVKADWEERQARKKEKEKAKAKEQEKKDGDGDKDKTKEDKEGKDERKETPSRTTTPSSPPATAQHSHQRYSLHRDIFAMRLAEHRKRRQTAQAKELAPRLPHAPNSTLP